MRRRVTYIGCGALIWFMPLKFKEGVSEGNVGRAVRVLLILITSRGWYKVSTHACSMRVAGARQAVQWQPSVGSKKGSWPLTQKWAASSLSFNAQGKPWAQRTVVT
jgi:hypothetical protein